MIPVIWFAAAAAGPLSSIVPFGLPVSDLELASSACEGAVRSFAGPRFVENSDIGRLAAGEQVDNWWASDGARLIAEAVRPTPEVPVGLDSTSLQTGPISYNFRVTIAVATKS